MKVSLIMVSSLDGIIAKSTDHNAFTWTSPEDKQHFVSMTKSIGTLLMGSSTYRTSGRKNYPGRHAYVLTSNPAQFEPAEGVTFMGGAPAEILQKIKDDGVENLALIGGAKVNSDFLKEGLVDDIYLTIEPILFGSGIRLCDDAELDYKLELVEMSKANERGTLILHYKIVK